MKVVYFTRRPEETLEREGRRRYRIWASTERSCPFGNAAVGEAMVAVKSSEAERFLAKLPAHICLYLVFGSDAGLVAERSRTILSRAVEDPKDPFQLLRISGDDLAADPLRLADEANTIPLFGGRRAIHVQAQGKSFIAALEPVIAFPPRDCTIVVEAGGLKKESALRKLCEREKNAAAIECYPDSAEDIARLIETEAAAAGLCIAPDARDYLASLLGEDRLVTRGELEKLMLYATGEKGIGRAHVEAIVAEASTGALEAALDAAFSGNFSALETEVQRVERELGDIRALIALALGHALALHRSRAGTDGSLPEGLGAGFVSFKRREMLVRHMRGVPTARLAALIDDLAEAASAARREPKLAEPLVMRALWKVASAARRDAKTTGPGGDGRTGKAFRTDRSNR